MKSSWSLRSWQRIALFAALSVGTAPAVAQDGRAFPLDTIQVGVGSRALQGVATSTRSVEVITRERIDRLGGTLADVLGRALNVDVLPRSPAQADIAIRGAAFEQVLVLVDGIRVSDQQTGHFDLDVGVPLQTIERIEILRGPGSTLYGPDAVGGVINIVTRTAGATRVSATGGSFGTAGLGAALAAGSGSTHIGLAADYRRSDGHRSGTDYRVAQGRLTLATPLRDGTLRANAAIGARDFGAADFYAPFPSYEETRSTTADLRFQPPMGDGVSIEPTLNFRYHKDDFILIREDPAVYRNMHDNYQAGAEVVARSRPGQQLALAWGAEGFSAWLESNALGSRRESRAAAFGEATLGSADRILVNAGLRIDWHDLYAPFVSPSLAGSLAVSEAVRLRASGTRGFRPPSWTDRYYVDPNNVGDPDLKPEEFWAGEIGLRARVPGDLRIDLAAFVRDANELIDWMQPIDDDEAPFLAMNVEDATFTGLELTMTRTFDEVEIEARAMALSVDADPVAGFRGRYALSPITETVGLSISVPVLEGGRLTLDGAHERRRSSPTGNGESSEGGYLRADARAEYDFGLSTVYLDLTNITDADYLDGSGVPVAGTALFVGLRWTGN